MSDEVLIAIDAGGTAVKVVAFDLSGTAIATRAADVETLHLGEGRVERDFAAFWEETVSALRQVVADCTGRQIIGLGCTGFGNGIVLLDAKGQATRPAIVSVDHRAQGLVEQLEASGAAAQISAITGHRLWGGQTLMLFAHLAATEPEVMARTRWALPCKDALRFCLTGEALSDPTDASGGGLMDVAAGGYALGVLEQLGLGPHAHRLAPIRPSTAPAGRITAAVAAQTGLPEGLVVAGSMMDVAACAVGAGAVAGAGAVSGAGAQVLTMIAGTWSINSLECAPPPPGTAPILNMLYRGTGTRLIAEGSPCSAANLGWFLERALGGRVSLAEANDLVAASPVAGARCQFLPHVFGPEPQRGSFLDLSASDDLGTMLRAIYEGVAFQARRHGEHAVALSGSAFPPVIRLAGGAAKSPVWGQIFADVCQRPVEAVRAPEVGALGAAICAAVAVGAYRDLETAVAAMSGVAQRYCPDPEHGALLARRFARFCALEGALEGSGPG